MYKKNRLPPTVCTKNQTPHPQYTHNPKQKKDRHPFASGHLSVIFFLSHLRDSNPRPTHYECVALPTEPRWPDISKRLQRYEKKGLHACFAS